MQLYKLDIKDHKYPGNDLSISCESLYSHINQLEGLYGIEVVRDHFMDFINYEEVNLDYGYGHKVDIKISLL